MSTNLSEKQKIAEKEHKEFVDLMHPYFGLREHPGYLPLTVRPLFAAGMLKNNPLRILLNEDCNGKRLSYTIWHESSHFLHYKINPERVFYSDEKGTRLGEIVAEFGALIYLDSINKLGSETFEEWDINAKMNLNMTNKDILAVMNSSMFDKKLLQRLAKSKNWKTARKIMRPHYKEAEFYLESICRLGINVSRKDVERLSLQDNI